MSAFRFLCCCAAILVLSGCSGEAPDVYAPPFDRKPLNGFGTSPIGIFANMKDKNVDAYLVRDIDKNLEGGSWRWAHQHPELRFFLDATSGWKFRMDFAVAGSTFEQTGPVTISYFINSHFIDKVTYNEPGNKQFEKAVPASVLIPRSINTVSIEMDKTWVSPVDGARLGFILAGAGFVR